MKAWAKFRDGCEIEESIFKLLVKYAPSGKLDIFASDQHNSYLKLTSAYFKHIGEDRKANDEDVKEVCRRFARSLGGVATGALFNQLAFRSPGFRDILGRNVLLIGRLEDTNTVSLDSGKGELAQLSIQPEECASEVDAFKTLVKLNPSHKESWKKNQAWLKDIFERCKKLDKPLFNETLIFQLPGESKLDMAKRLPDALIKLAKDFGPYGHFYKTQVPVLWIEEDGKITKVSSPKTIRETAEAMARVVPRPMLLLSAAVDFEQYASQYGIVADIFCGPMCGRAYFKEAFTDPDTKDWDSLERNFKKIAIPRIRHIKNLTNALSKPFWENFSWMSDEAKSMCNISGKSNTSGVKADYGY
jgi:tagatose-1,6-bisphosphate aldolase